MRRRGPLVTWLIAVAGGVVFTAITAGVETEVDAQLTARLEALRPEDPMAYFELAEELADIARDDATRELARRLFGLAGAIDPIHLGRSACLALADVEPNDASRRRLLALASLLGGRPLAGSNVGNIDDEFDEAVSLGAAVALTESFSFYRRGEGPRAVAALREPGAIELLTAYEWLIPGGLQRYLADGKLYRGQLRPSTSEEYIVRMLEFEVALLSGPDRPWSSDLLLSRGRPLIEVDPDRIAQTLGVDPTRALYRGGHWVRTSPDS